MLQIVQAFQKFDVVIMGELRVEDGDIKCFKRIGNDYQPF